MHSFFPRTFSKPTGAIERRLVTPRQTNSAELAISIKLLLSSANNSILAPPIDKFTTFKSNFPLLIMILVLHHRTNKSAAPANKANF